MKMLFKRTLFLLLLLPITTIAQSVISGTVVDATLKQPVPGVNVIVDGTTNGTTTDFDGNYTLSGVNQGSKITFSYLGFRTQTIPFTGQGTLNVTLTEDASELDAVVVVGYGTTTKKDLTGSVALIGEDDFNKGNNVTAENLLNGRVAGLTVNTGGSPGSNSEIRIRGGASLNASNDPLIVIDGLPVSNVANGTRSIISSINPADIESFSVLKDASAAAIYGNRGANGVIIITTKKGKQGLKVSFDSQASVSRLTDKIDVFNAAEFRSLVTERFPDRVDLLGNANTDWQDAIYRDAFSSQHNLSVSGALADNLPARLSVGYADQEGLRKTSSFERTTTSLSLNPRFFEGNLKIDFNANLNFERNQFAPGIEGNALQFNPTQPIYDPNSQYGGFYEYTGANGLILGNVPRNPVAQLMQTQDIASVRRYYGNFKVDYKLPFYEPLRAVVNLGLDESTSDRFYEVDRNSALGTNAEEGETLGQRSDTDFKSSNRLFDAYLVHTKAFGDFNTEITAGYSYQIFENENFTTNNVRDPNSAPPENTISPDVVLLAYFARGNFNYQSKYFLSASIRRDGTSRFGPDERFGYFPAVSGAWQISDEDFLKDSETLSALKLRLGYGITGQQDISSQYDYLSRYGLGDSRSQYLFGDQYYTIGQPFFRNAGIKWEEITEYNAGIDYGFFNGKLSGSLDFFRKESNDLLSSAPVPDGVNFSNQGFQNIGKFTTQGVEFVIDYNVVSNDNFNWNVNYNTTYIDREINKLAFGQDILTQGISGGTGNTIQVQREGFAPNSFFVYRQLYDTAGAPIEGAYVDVNNDGILNDDDKYIAGNGRADVTMGFQSTMNYKDWDFSFNLRASFGNDIYNNVNSGNAQYGNVFRTVLNNVPTQVLETNFVNTPDVILSDYYLEDADFLRMDNITLGYTFDADKMGKGTLRLWGGVQNVFVITDYSGLDPEITNNGVDNTIFPRGRTFLFGLNYGF
ncbi:SusC/RagA family TonB-linked outer membrane protein [Leeuwenhoekiella sp. LLG6367-2.1]|uniref:SusC/RagA family TonB-linked outer membrane protein n=1 Tax=Leeuwenhoekiella sp. LLG6367-2.1 TaxID=3160833 RepID=UPI003870074E